MTDTTTPALSFQNTVLSKLPSSTVARLHLMPMSWQVGQYVRLVEPERQFLLFIETGKLGMSLGLESGDQIEVALLGSSSVANGAALLGAGSFTCDIVGRSAGSGYVCSVKSALEEFSSDSVFRDLLLSSMQVQFYKTAQLVACNASHALEQRLSSWLLRLVADSDMELIEMTQEQLSTILGVRRTTITMAMDEFRGRQLIDYKRGRIRVLDTAGLERTACSCYSMLRVNET